MRRQPQRHRRPYAPGIDGLRALAVLAVFGYHADIAGLRGGFLGVDVFFVISGYLITDLLLAERRRRGAIDLKQFWIRRARRLLPALAVMLVVVSAGAVVFDRQQLGGLRGDLLAAATYTSNWHQIHAHSSYFAAFGPQPLLVHLWSLAVEEQFYVAWPLLLLLLCAVIRLRGRQVAIVLAGALAATVAMAVGFHSGSDPSRLYYGTDTHATGLLIGAALAIGLAGRRPRCDAFGTLCLGGLLFCAFLIGDSSVFAYRGGFLLVSALTAGTVAAAAAPAGLLGRALGMTPLRWIGTRSYGIYLWHWPVLCLVRAQVGGQPRLAGSLVELALVVLLAQLSWRFVEDPVRRAGFSAAIRSAGRALAARSAPRLVAGGTAAAVALVACVGVALPAPRDSVAAQIKAGERVVDAPPMKHPVGARRVAGTGVTAIGDSVLLASAQALRAALPGIAVDARIGRQMSVANKVVASLRATGRLGRVVVVDLGTNGDFTTQTLAQLMTTIGPSRKVLLLTVYARRSWQDAVNMTVRAAPLEWPNVTVVDWHDAIAHRQSLLWTDHVHPRPQGARLYAKLVTAALPASVR